jgi:hypothetical protein
VNWEIFSFYIVLLKTPLQPHVDYRLSACPYTRHGLPYVFICSLGKIMRYCLCSCLSLAERMSAPHMSATIP